MSNMTSSGLEGEQTQEQHQGIISHAAEKFHLKKPTKVVAEKTVRSSASFPPRAQPWTLGRCVSGAQHRCTCLEARLST